MKLGVLIKPLCHFRVVLFLVIVAITLSIIVGVIFHYGYFEPIKQLFKNLEEAGLL